MVKPTCSTDILMTSTITVAFDMTPVWKSAFQVPVLVHTIFDITKNVSFAASRERRQNYCEIDDRSELFNV